MAVGRRGTQQAINQASAAVASLSVSLPGAATAADLMILGVSAFNHIPGTTSVTDNQTGNSYVRDRLGSALNAVADGRSAIYSAMNINASGTFTITYNFGTNQIETIYAAEYSGVKTTAATDVGAGGGAAASNQTLTTATTGTTAQNDELAVACVSFSTSGNATLSTTGSGWATSNQQPDGTQFQTGALSDKLLTGTGTQVNTWTFGTGYGGFDACIQTYLGAAAGGGLPAGGGEAGVGTGDSATQAAMMR